MSNQQFVEWFRASAPYIKMHRGKTFVIWLPGGAMAHPNLVSIVHDLTLLDHLGIRLVICFGARSQISAVLGNQSRFHRNRRITMRHQMPLVHGVAGELRHQLESLFSQGLTNTPMQGADIKLLSGNLITAKPLGVVEGIDHHHTGTVRRIAIDTIDVLLSQGHIVLLPPIGYSATGESFSLASHEIAAAVADGLKADKLLLFAEDNGLSQANGSPLREISATQLQAVYRQLPISDDLKQACETALDSRVLRVQIVSYQEPGALLNELFSREGIGSLIYRDQYQDLRQAEIQDVNGILDLISPLEQQQLLVRRSRDLIERDIHCFQIVLKDGAVIACAALFPFSDGQSGELSCIATHPDFRNQGLGDKLLSSLETQAKGQGLSAIYLLTTQAAHWFIERGFTEIPVNLLPGGAPSPLQLATKFQSVSEVA